MGLKKLNWTRILTAESPMHTYKVRADGEVDGKFIVKKTRLETGQTETVTGFDSVEAAQDWCYHKHYLPKMQKWLEPDSVTDIVNWFKAAKPEPTVSDLCTQIGCHLEEVCEQLEALGLQATGAYIALKDLSKAFKDRAFYLVSRLKDLTHQQKIDLVDSCCDVNVTSTGIMALLNNVDVLGAQCEVIRSNNSKMVGGKFEFDENGKIKKPKSFSEPDLKPFLGVKYGKA